MVKKPKVDMSIAQSTNVQHRLIEGMVYNYTFNVSDYQALHAHTIQSEWIIDFGCTHHITKHACPFSSISEVFKKREKIGR